MTIDCKVCGEEARPWHDKRHDEKGWCCTSSTCTGGARTTRYAADWAYERLGKTDWMGVICVIMIGIVISTVIYVFVVSVRTPDAKIVTKYQPIVNPCIVAAHNGATCLYDARLHPDDPDLVACNPEVDIFYVADRIGCYFPKWQPPQVDGGKRGTQGE